MIKKQLYIYFLFTACFLQLGHGSFSHTHIKAHHHNGKDHHHQAQHPEESGLSLLFSHFNHNSDTFLNDSITVFIKIVKEVSYPLPFFEDYSFTSKLFDLYTRKAVVWNKDPFIFISPHLHSLQFRGPPALFI